MVQFVQFTTTALSLSVFLTIQARITYQYLVCGRAVWELLWLILSALLLRVLLLLLMRQMNTLITRQMRIIVVIITITVQCVRWRLRHSKLRRLQLRFDDKEVTRGVKASFEISILEIIHLLWITVITQVIINNMTYLYGVFVW